MRIYGIVGEDGGGCFFKASEFGASFETFLALFAQPGLIVDSWGFIAPGDEPGIWTETDLDHEFFEQMKKSNIKQIKEMSEDRQILRAFEYEVPDDTYRLDWGSSGDHPDDLPRACPRGEGHRAFTASCDLISPFPAVRFEHDPDL